MALFKSISQKSVSLKTSLPSNTGKFLFFFALFSVLLFWVFGSFGLPPIMTALLLTVIVIRMFFGRLRVSPGNLILFFGLPGSGKTMFLSKVARDNEKQRVLVNEEFSHLTLADQVYTREDLAQFRFDLGENALLLFDEASLNGFDNRDFSRNFSGEEGSLILEFFKKIRQYNSSCVFSNQGWDELDKKLRDGLCSRVYYVQNRGFYSVACCMIPEISISDIDGSIQQGYRYPSFLERLIDPSLQLYVVHRIMGKYYETIHPKSRPYK